MNKSPFLLLTLALLLVACGPDQLVSDLPSPDGRYHVELRKCPENGLLSRGEVIQVSLLVAGVSEKCSSALNALAQFDLRATADELQLEWLSNTEFRAWHPTFNPQYGPEISRQQGKAPVRMVFAPKR
ncbi:hypothetical protein ABZR71_03370 [Pseudomonas paraeruginosa]|uniref:hypothetical protein n=1 Tax=Pseudomonas aeruginosa group TaxID=136841 RepID=UPI00053DD894|nr:MULTISPECIES: hypothetical protein [Pseudomonas aeruginosa group]VTS24063.1 Uncharacterised protein [Streptococcus dysgalactiae subsp. equisimilis]KAB0739975.1 hypothetical protein F7O94_27670 [Pseudomonas aeruginosa]KPD29882.1 hypothetical protein AN920_09925 [Pseudomonas paraeruginosa]KQB28408.1 hypothetical protein AOA77_06120 [Pseudomonas paraeruginosa]KRU91206.1 hypothetical protein AN454_14365 [Pseudomonas aeruginosa]